MFYSSRLPFVASVLVFAGDHASAAPVGPSGSSFSFPNLGSPTTVRPSGSSFSFPQPPVGSAPSFGSDPFRSRIPNPADDGPFGRAAFSPVTQAQHPNPGNHGPFGYASASGAVPPVRTSPYAAAAAASQQGLRQAQQATTFGLGQPGQPGSGLQEAYSEIDGVNLNSQPWDPPAGGLQAAFSSAFGATIRDQRNPNPLGAAYAESEGVNLNGQPGLTSSPSSVGGLPQLYGAVDGWNPAGQQGPGVPLPSQAGQGRSSLGGLTSAAYSSINGLNSRGELYPGVPQAGRPQQNEFTGLAPTQSRGAFP